MPEVSPYLSPHRTEAVWDVSGAFVADRELVAFHQFCREALGLEPFHIVHGAPLCLWNSGRVLSHMMREAEDVRQAGLAYEQLGISVYLTFTNLLLGPQELKDPTGHALCRFFTRHNPTGRNAAIIANHGLRELLRREYPDLRLISSVLHITNNEPERSPDVYRRLADEYDEVMVHPDDVRRPELLEKLENKDKYILLVNEYCIRNCPIRSFHYRSLSEQALNFLSYDDSRFAQAQANNGCGNLHTLLSDEKRRVLALNEPEINALYDMGFRHFKLQGRGHANAAPLLADLLRLILRSDGPAESSMHAVGVRFWESLSPASER